MLMYERQIREKLASELPREKNASDRTKPIEGLDLIKSSLIDGYQRALTSDREDIPLLFQNEDPNTVGYLLEGAGMAFTMLDEMNNSDEHYLPILFKGRPESELIFCAIGVGWASGKLSKALNWIPEGIPNKWAEIIANGYGFHQGFSNPEGYKSDDFFHAEEDSMENFNIGLGRALWFIYEGEVESIVEVINNLEPSRQPLMWQGIGIACEFNRFFKKKSMLMKLSSSNESHLLTGFEIGSTLKQELISN